MSIFLNFIPDLMPVSFFFEAHFEPRVARPFGKRGKMLLEAFFPRGLDLESNSPP